MKRSTKIRILRQGASMLFYPAALPLSARHAYLVIDGTPVPMDRGRMRATQFPAPTACSKRPRSMMVTMSSLVTLAHATAAPAFNGLFYATTATIIPVLFLAIGVQRDSLYQYLLEVLVRADDRRVLSAPKRGLGRTAASVAVIVLPP
jgi:hypothetical protein